MSIVWSAPAEQGDDGALDLAEMIFIQSGVAPRLPQHSTSARL
ncbi:MAG: hypothetical protein ACREBG_18370 [Pyrinomonadaceae bacterium]